MYFKKTSGAIKHFPSIKRVSNFYNYKTKLLVFHFPISYKTLFPTTKKCIGKYLCFLSPHKKFDKKQTKLKNEI